MSYLIALYVYYHGNNLGAFGFVKGSEEIKDQNKGMRQVEDIQFSNILPESDIEIMRRNKIVEQETNYDEILRQAILRNQQQSLALVRNGLVQNRVLDNTPVGTLDELMDEGSIGMDFFDELNGF